MPHSGSPASPADDSGDAPDMPDIPDTHESVPSYVVITNTALDAVLQPCDPKGVIGLIRRTLGAGRRVVLEPHPATDFVYVGVEDTQDARAPESPDPTVN